MAEYQIVAGCDLNPEPRHRFENETGARAHVSYHEMLKEPPDVVIINLPHYLHVEATLASLASKCNVIVEKPMAISVAECNRMLQAAKQAKRSLIVAEAASFYPGPVRTGQKFQEGLLGGLFSGYMPCVRDYFNKGRPNWFLNPATSGGGMFCNVGLHRLAMSRACLPGLHPGSIASCTSRPSVYPVEACTSALVRYIEGGAILYEEVGYHPRPEWLPMTPHLIFEEGIVTWDDTAWRMQGRDGSNFSEPLPPRTNDYLPIYENMIKAINGEPYQPAAADLAVDVALAQAAYSSSDQSRTIKLNESEWTINR